MPVRKGKLQKLELANLQKICGVDDHGPVREFIPIGVQ
jgi:hypothetical protein